MRRPLEQLVLSALVLMHAPAFSACAPFVFTNGVAPPACWRPFSFLSPFNKPLPANPRLHPDSKALVAWLGKASLPGPNDLQVIDTVRAPELDYSKPTYYSRPDDPEYRLLFTMPYANKALNGTALRIPAQALPAGGQDAHMTVIDPVRGLVFSLFGVRSKPLHGGVLSAFAGGVQPLSSDGVGGHGGTSAGFSNPLGLIREAELVAGRIDHALFAVVDCTNGQWQWPAVGPALACGASPVYNGMHFYLDMTPAEINALELPPWRKTILRAMAGYGMFVGDTSGGQGARWQVQPESGRTFSSFGKAIPLVEFARENGIPYGNGQYRMNLRDGIDWGRLKVLAPCVARDGCLAN